MQSRAWREAAWIFGLNRLFTILLSIISILLLPRLLPTVKQTLQTNDLYKNDPYTLHGLLFSWYRWDVLHYVNISFQGYKYTPDVAFFPLWPLLQHYTGLLLGGHYPDSYYFAGLLLSNLCFYLALVLLYRLVADDFTSAVARRTLIYLTFTPYGLFFFAGYTESLFVLLCVATFLLWQRGKSLDWWGAGLLGFLASLTRATGFILGVPFLIIYLQRFWMPSELNRHSWREKLNAFVPILLLPLGLVIYMLYLYYTKGDPFILSSQEATWQRHFSLPWDTVALIIRTLLVPSVFWLNLLFLGFTLFPLSVLGLGWKRIPLHYRLFALVMAALVLSFPLNYTSPLTSQPRYLIIIFPIFVILAIWGKAPRFHQCYITTSVVLFSINVFLFVANYWIV